MRKVIKQYAQSFRRSMSRWIIVSNRLPFSLAGSPDKKTQKIKQSSGGLVTAINGIKTKNEIRWIGSLAPGINENHIKNFKSKKNVSFSYPVISEELYDAYYNGFCNDVLWPLLHYETDLIQYKKENYDAYVKVNRIFAQHIAKVAKKNDVIWINDFHLFMTPQFIKEINPSLKVGFFLHVPFPSSELYRELPCRKELLEALLYSDLIGFHDFSYLRHLSSAAYNVLGYESSLLDIETPRQSVKLGVYPVSIDTQDFMNKAVSKKTSSIIEEYQLKKGRQRKILGVDRLDYSKGIPHKLKAFKKFLEDNPQMVGKVQLTQIAVPSRTEVPEYIKLRHEVERLVSEINGKFSKINYIPVKYIFDSVSVFELMALYRSSDVLFITSKRDGMNLVCLEYIVAQDARNPGVVLLSEYAGASSTLSHATLINPMNIGETANKLGQALNQSLSERKKNHQVMLDYLKGYTATDWARAFITHLERDVNQRVSSALCLDKAEERKKIIKKNKNGSKVLLLDFDGTLSPIQEKPDQVKLSIKIRRLLKSLSEENETEVVIVTGRDKNFIVKQLKGLKVYIACEHGASFYDYKNNKWRQLAASKNKPWLKDAKRIFEQYERRTPNSFVEEKEFALCWHYRQSPNDFAEFQARKLLLDLGITLAHEPVTVSRGKKIVEVKSLEANKGYFTDWFLERYVDSQAKIIAMGDDRTDEDMFKALERRGETIKIGHSESSYAKFYLSDQDLVEKFLEELV
ncbi:MAG: hypothetical protein CME65_03075 [Halobacteriovoraceae bacterium]|nr:hypothetical protein [Halobacteriovoraceae bacterium]